MFFDNQFLTPPISVPGCVGLLGVIPNYILTIGRHDLRDGRATTSAFIPNDPTLVGLPYTVQGFCGGYATGGRLSSAVTQTIGN